MLCSRCAKRQESNLKIDCCRRSEPESLRSPATLLIDVVNNAALRAVTNLLSPDLARGDVALSWPTQCRVFGYPRTKEKTMVRTSSKLFVRFLFLLSLSLVLAMAPSAAYAAKTIAIEEARALPLGSVVTIKGTITVASGAFASSTFD